MRARQCRIKMCGMRREEDIQYANQVKPDAIGMMLAPSKRQVTLEEARSLRQALDPDIEAVGVFVNAPMDEVRDKARELDLDAVQLHGDETAEDIETLRQELPERVKIYKAFRVEDDEDIDQAEESPADGILLDSHVKGTYGGSGKVGRWDVLAHHHFHRPYVLAGGLRSDNITKALELLHPEALDISSGIETEGYKDLDKMKAVMTAIEGE